MLEETIIGIFRSEYEELRRSDIEIGPADGISRCGWNLFSREFLCGSRDEDDIEESWLAGRSSSGGVFGPDADLKLCACTAGAAELPVSKEPSVPFCCEKVSDVEEDDEEE